MTTAPPPTRLGPPLPPRPSAPPSGGGAPGLNIDFVRLLRQYKWILGASAIAGLALGVAAHMVLLRTAPQFRASVVYAVQPPQAAVTNQQLSNTDLNELDRYALTQSRIMVSDRILRDAVRQPKVRNEATTWASKFVREDGQVDVTEAWKDLRDRVSARPAANTTLIELTVTMSTPIDAAVIAGEVHEAYFRDLQQTNNNVSREQRTALESRATTLRTDLARIEERRNRILEENRITSNNPDVNVEVDKLRNIEPEIVRLQQAQDQFRTDLKRMEEQLQAEGVPQYGPELREQVETDPVIQNFKSEVADYKSRIEALLAGRLGRDHRDVVNLRELMQAKENELNNLRERKLSDLFNATIANTRNAIDRVRAQIEEMSAQREAAVKRREEITRVMAEYVALGRQKDDLTNEQNEVRSALQNITSMDLTVSTARIGRMRLIEPPRLPEVASFPRLSVMLPAGLVMCVGLVSGLILVRELLDTRIKGPSDVAHIRGMKLLGIVPSAADDPGRPASPESAYRDAPTGAIAESFRQLRPGLLKRLHAGNHKTVLVVGATPGSGASTVLANLAAACAYADHRVLMVDGNLRRPNLHKYFKLAEGPGLGNILARQGTLESAVQQTGVDNLHLLAAGNAQFRAAPERLGTELFSQFLREAAEKYDLVLIDSAPALVAGDGLAIANRCDASIFVVRALAEKRGLVSRIAHQLAETRAEPMGVIVNAVRASAGGYLRGNIRQSFEYHNNGQAA